MLTNQSPKNGAKEFKIAKNSVFNLLGWALPVLLNFISIPYIVHNLGSEQYGLLVLVGAFIGYFSLLDINLTQGSIKYIAEYYALYLKEEVNQVITLGLTVYSLIGLIGLLSIALCVYLVPADFFKVSVELRRTFEIALYIAALGFVTNILLNYFLSIPKAIHRFDISSKIEMAITSIQILLTVLLLFLGYGLIAIIVMRVVVSCFGAIIAYIWVKRLIPYFRFSFSFRKKIARNVFSFSAYSFLSNIAAVISIHTDKIIIGTLIGAAQVTFYAIPMMLIRRLTAMSSRISVIIFPISSELAALKDYERLHSIYLKGQKYLFFGNLFIVMLVTVFANGVLTLWMGVEFAEKSWKILVILGLSCLADTLTNLPTLVNNGLNHPKVTGVFSLIRAFVGAGAIALGAILFGILGVAWAELTVSVSFALIFNVYVHRKTIKLSFLRVVRESLFSSMIFATIMFGVAPLTAFGTYQRVDMLLLKMAAFATVFCVYGYFFVIDSEIRSRIIARLIIWLQRPA